MIWLYSNIFVMQENSTLLDVMYIYTKFVQKIKCISTYNNIVNIIYELTNYVERWIYPIFSNICLHIYLHRLYTYTLFKTPFGLKFCKKNISIRRTALNIIFRTKIIIWFFFLKIFVLQSLYYSFHWFFLKQNKRKKKIIKISLNTFTKLQKLQLSGFSFL